MGKQRKNAKISRLLSNLLLSVIIILLISGKRRVIVNRWRQGKIFQATVVVFLLLSELKFIIHVIQSRLTIFIVIMVWRVNNVGVWRKTFTSTASTQISRRLIWVVTSLAVEIEAIVLIFKYYVKNSPKVKTLTGLHWNMLGSFHFTHSTPALCFVEEIFSQGVTQCQINKIFPLRLF